MLSEWQMTGTDSRNVFKSLQKYIIRIARSKDCLKNLFQIVIKLACGWNRMRKVCKCLQKYIIRIAKKQGQFQKTCFEMLSKWHVTEIESRKSLKVCISVSFDLLRSKDSFKNNVSKCYQPGLWLESNEEKSLNVCRSVSFELLRSKDSFKNYILKRYQNGRSLELNQKKCLKVCRSISFELLRSQDSFKNDVSKCYKNDM